MNKESLWVVTKEYNLYEQEGEYFVAAFNHKPTFQDLKPIGGDDITTGKLTRGGGRHALEFCWYNLHEVQSGALF